MLDHSGEHNRSTGDLVAYPMAHTANHIAIDVRGDVQSGCGKHGNKSLACLVASVRSRCVVSVYAA